MSAWQHKSDQVGRVFHRKKLCSAGGRHGGNSCVEARTGTSEWTPCDG